MTTEALRTTCCDQPELVEINADDSGRLWTECLNCKALMTTVVPQCDHGVALAMTCEGCIHRGEPKPLNCGRENCPHPPPCPTCKGTGILSEGGRDDLCYDCEGDPCGEPNCECHARDHARLMELL